MTNPPPRDFTPREYQTPAIDFIVENERCNLFARMGMGKSVSALSALDKLHVCGYESKPALVLGPLRVARDVWPKELKKWRHLSGMDMATITGTETQRLAALRRDVPLYSINYENLIWLQKTLGNHWPFGMVIADECFIGGTLVDTPCGARRIENLKVGDLVGSHEGPRRITRVYRHETNALNLVSLKLSNGIEIHATGNHPFFTDLGWRAARDCAGRQVYRADQMPNMPAALRAGCSDSEVQGETRADPVLLEVLPNQGHFCAAPGTPSASRQKHESDYGRARPLEPGRLVVGGAQSQDIGMRQSAETKTESAGRKRDRDVADGSVNSTFNARRFYMELRGAIRAKVAGLSLPLQVGFREPRREDRTRSGRRLPPDHPREDPRREENRDAGVVRVESVSCSKRTGMETVFNLEVEGAHTYFAGGVLVHNCTKLKAFRTRQGSQRAKAIAQYAFGKGTTRWLNLTGTPASNGLKDLWGQMWFIDRGQRLGRSYSAFTDRWFQAVPNGNAGFTQLKPMAHADDQIQAAIRDVSLTLDPKDYFDLADPVIVPVYIELPPAARKVYNDMAKAMFAQIESEGVEAFNAGARTQKCQQISNGAIYKNALDGKPASEWLPVHDAKLQALDSILEEAGGTPLLVAYNFKSDLARLLKAFPKGVDLSTRTGFAAFMKGDVPVGFAHPASLGHGVDGLQDVTNLIAFFGHDWNLEYYEQMIERVGPMRQLQSGHDRNVFVYHIIAEDTIDEDIVARRASKASVQDALMRAMKRFKNSVDT